MDMDLQLNTSVGLLDFGIVIIEPVFHTMGKISSIEGSQTWSGLPMQASVNLLAGRNVVTTHTHTQVNSSGQ